MRKLFYSFFLLFCLFIFIPKAAFSDSCSDACLSDAFAEFVDYFQIGYGSGMGYLEGESMYDDADDKRVPSYIYLGLGAAPVPNLRLDLFADFYTQKGIFEYADGTEETHKYNIITLGLSIALIPFEKGPFFKLGFGTCAFTAEGSESRYGKQVFENETYSWKSYNGAAFIAETGFLVTGQDLFQVSLNARYAYQTYYKDPEDEDDGPNSSYYFVFYATFAIGDFSFK